MDERELAQTFEVFQEAAKENKNVDVAALMLGAMHHAEENRLSNKQRNSAYLVSLLFPPLGLFFALYYMFSDKSDAKRVALICVIITAVVVVITIFAFQSILSGAGVSSGDLSKIKIQDVTNILQ